MDSLMDERDDATPEEDVAAADSQVPRPDKTKFLFWLEQTQRADLDAEAKVTGESVAAIIRRSIDARPREVSNGDGQA